MQYVNPPGMPQVQPQLLSTAQVPPQQQAIQGVVGGGGSVNPMPQNVDPSRIQPQPQHPHVTYYQLPYPVFVGGHHPQPQHYPQVLNNPVPARVNVNSVQVAPMSPRTAQNPSSTIAGSGSEKSWTSNKSGKDFGHRLYLYLYFIPRCVLFNLKPYH